MAVFAARLGSCESRLAEYTEELINVLSVLGLLVELEPTKAAFLDEVLSVPLISDEELQLARAFDLLHSGAQKVSPQGGQRCSIGEAEAGRNAPNSFLIIVREVLHLANLREKHDVADGGLAG